MILDGTMIVPERICNTHCCKIAPNRAEQLCFLPCTSLPLAESAVKGSTAVHTSTKAAAAAVREQQLALSCDSSITALWALLSPRRLRAVWLALLSPPPAIPPQMHARNSSTAWPFPEPSTRHRAHTTSSVVYCCCGNVLLRSCS